MLMLTANTLLLVASGLWLPYSTLNERLSVGSAWVCMVFLCAAMLIGPLRRAAGKTAPANIYLRRDLGMWAALQAFIHFYFGTVVSMNQTYIQAFVHVDTPSLPIETRDQMFAWGSSMGLAAGAVLLLLLLISSDRALRLLSTERWKKLQKAAHLALWLTVIHGFVFQVLEARYLPLAVLAVITLFVFGLQFRGRRSSV